MPRAADYPIDPAMLERWSPRAFDGSAMEEEALFALFEAARWAPSAFNVQPWRFVYALRDMPEWDALLACLVPMNASWAKQASALVFILSDTLFTPPGQTEAVPARTNSFDAGAAWAMLALQAAKDGLSAHAMAGFDSVRAGEVIGAGDRFKIEAAVAIGRRGDRASLPEPLQAREVPSPRRPIADTIFKGQFAPTV